MQQKLNGDAASGPMRSSKPNARFRASIFCGVTGGAERWLMIPLDLSKPPISYIRQALEALPEKARVGRDGKPFIPFFGEVLGIILNYSPGQAVRCDLEGRPLEILPKAYRPGELRLSLGGRPVEPRVIARILGV